MTPFDTTEMLAAGLYAVRRTIREEEPHRPSTRLTRELVARRAERGKQRGAIPRLWQGRELVKQLRGDLDWITQVRTRGSRAP